MAYLVIDTPNSPTQRMMLQDRTVVGRAIGCELWIDDSKLSRHHCTIHRDGEDWVLTDLGSSNGTFIKGWRIVKQVLQEGDTIQVGRANITFHRGTFIAYRPADPIEAASMGPGLLRRESASENSTLVGQRMPTARLPSPAPPPAPPPEPAREGGATSLPFTRPPAKPIVAPDAADQPGNEPGVSSRWINALMSMLRRES